MQRYRGRLDAYTTYLIFTGMFSLFLALIQTVNLVYQVEVAHLNPLQLVLVGTALESVCFIFQVPTGVLADVYSRRLAIIAGTLILGAGYVLEGSIPQFLMIMIGQAMFGIGATLIDGAEQAWIADEVGESDIGRVFIRSSQIGLLGGLLGALLSVVLASQRLNLPIVLGGSLVMLLAIFLFFVMPENNFHIAEKDQRHSWRALGKTFTDGLSAVRMRPVLTMILLVGLFYGLYSEGVDRLSAAHLLNDYVFPTFWHLKPVVWFGVFSVVGTLLSLGGTEIVRRHVNMNNQRVLLIALFVLNSAMVLLLLLFALAGNFPLVVLAYLGFGAARSINQPIYTTWLTQNIDAKVRATVISMGGQVDALGQIIGGPPVGYVGSLFSLRAALVASSIILAPVLFLFALVVRKSKNTLPA